MVKESNPKLQKLFLKFDAGLMLLIDQVSGKLNKACDKVEKRLDKCERTILNYVDGAQKKLEDELDRAESIVKKKVRSSVIMSEWVSTFAARTDDQILDPITFAFSRFALNVSMCYDVVSPAYYISSRIHYLLISLLGFQSNIVIGPALLGLVHLSLLYEMKHEIVIAGSLPNILKLLVYNKSLTVLSLACKLTSSLAILEANKVQLTNAGCFHAVLDVIAGVNPEVNDVVKGYACSAVCNLLVGNDANRALTIELDAIRPIITLLQMSVNEAAILNAIKALGNIAYNNSYTATAVLRARGDVIAVTVLEASDMLRQVELTRAGLALLTNLSNGDMNQSHVGSTKGALAIALRVCEHARDPLSVANAASFIIAITYRNIANKARVGSSGVISPLLKRLIRYATREEEKYVLCLEKVCAAMASLLLYHPNHEKLYDIGGLEEVLRLGNTYSNKRLLQALAPIIAATVPNPAEYLKCHLDLTPVPAEVLGALPVLRRIKMFVYGRDSVPEWLADAITTLSTPDEGLPALPVKDFKEYKERMYPFQELPSEVLPDFDVMNFPEGRGLIFSIY